MAAFLGLNSDLQKQVVLQWVKLSGGGLKA